jgi:hypothetical protein
MERKTDNTSQVQRKTDNTSQVQRKTTATECISVFSGA